MTLAARIWHTLATRALTLDEYHDALPQLTRPICWRTGGRRRTGHTPIG